MRRGFTLIEMLMVILVIGILLALMFPAIQKFREASNRTQCINNLQQMALACQAHHDLHDHLPSSGWGWTWLGCPHRGNGPDQPGGWAYNILPFIERNDLRKLGYGKTGTDFITDMNLLVHTPVSLYNCPTRRTATLYPNYYNYGYRSADSTTALQTFTPDKVVRSDYAGNATDPSPDYDQRGPGPNTATDGDSQTWWNTTPPYSTAPLPVGVLFQRSKVQRSDISRGVSNVYLIGERYLNTNSYYTGADGADNETFYAGYNNDVCRTAANGPRQDAPGVGDTYAFGSAHHGGFHMSFCDGSVRFIEYNVSTAVFSQGGSRFAN